MKKYCFLFMMFIALNANAQSWTKDYDYVDEFSSGLAKVTKGSKYGYVNKQGVLVVPLIYDEAMTLREGKATVQKGGKWGYIDSTGKEVEEFKYEDAGCFRDSLAVVRLHGKYGFVDHNFKVVIPFNFESARGFSEGLAPVSNNKGLWGYINRKGNLVFECQYNFADFFVDGQARVMKNGNLIMIDKKGKEVKENEQ